MSPIKIFVGNIAVGTSSQELSDLFARYGEVTECDILGAGNYAFVHMGSESDGELAIKELNGFALNRSELNIEKSTSATQGRRRKEFPPDLGSGPRQGGRGGGGGGGGSHRGIPKRSTTKIFVGNIKEGTTNAELKAIFEPHGSVVEADVVGGFGFVHMQSQGEAIKAIKALNGTYLNENRINIELSTEATQGRSRELADEAGGDFSMVEEFMPRGRLLARGRGHPLMAGRRFHPYDNALGAVPSYRRGLYPSADPYAAAAYASAYGAMDYARDPYALALSAPVLVPRAPRAAPAAAAAASGTSDTFARQLLNLYIKDPSSFDKFAKNPLIQESLELDGAQDEEDPYYRPPKEYYEAKSATSTSAFRGSGLDAAYGAGDGYAAIPRRQPLLSVGSSRGLVGAGLPAPRSLSFIGGGALMGHRPLGAPVPRPRLPPPRTANLYTSFE